MNNVNDSGRWGGLLSFTMEFASPSDRVYANGLQQVQLKMGFELADKNGNPIQVGSDEIKDFILVEHVRGTDIPHATPITGASAEPVQWDWSNLRDASYKFYPAEGALPEADGTNPSGQNILYRDFWVRSKARAPLQIGAKITLRDGSVFTSKDMANGSVTVVPVAVPTYSPRAYTLTATTFSRHGVSFDYVPFVLRSGGVLMEFPHFSMTPDSIAKHSGRASPSVAHVALTGYTSAPGRGLIKYSQFNSYLPSVISHEFSRPGRPIILVASSTFNVAHSPVPSPNRAGRISAVDMYGNPHTLTLNFTRDGDQDREISLI